MWIMTNCQSRECARYWLILFPDLLWTKPKARSGQIRFALRDRLSGMASAHAQHKFGAVKAKADFDAYNKLTRGLRHDLGIFARISKFHCFHETKQTPNEVERFFLITNEWAAGVLVRAFICKFFNLFSLSDVSLNGVCDLSISKWFHLMLCAVIFCDLIKATGITSLHSLIICMHLISSF